MITFLIISQQSAFCPHPGPLPAEMGCVGTTALRDQGHSPMSPVLCFPRKGPGSPHVGKPPGGHECGHHHVPGSLGGTATQAYHCPNLGSSSPSGPSPPHSIVPTSFQELPDPEKVSTEVQQMWVLTEVIRARQAAARIGRFDVSPITLLTGTPALPHGSAALSEGLLPAGWGWSIPALLCRR